MGKQYSTYVLREIQGDPFPDAWRTISFGRCTEGFRAAQNLWFVNFLPLPQNSTYYAHTFFVDADHIGRFWFDELRRDPAKWSAISQDFIVGDWDPKNERFWKDNPVYTHTLPDGVVVQYGYSPVQASGNPDRELWFVVLPGPHGFIVDKEAATPAMMDAIGSNFWDWVKICWCHLEHETDWLFNAVHSIALDSPWTLAEIDERLTEYRAKIRSIPIHVRGRTPRKQRRWWEFWK